MLWRRRAEAQTTGKAEGRKEADEEYWPHQQSQEALLRVLKAQ
jgi:hypothetical protein